MAKELKTAEELAEMIKSQLVFARLQVIVVPHPSLGWTASVVATPTRSLVLQLEVDVVASRVRTRFDLKFDLKT